MVSGTQDLLGTAGSVGYESNRVETHTAYPDKVTGTNAVLALSRRSPSSHCCSSGALDPRLPSPRAPALGRDRIAVHKTYYGA